MTTITIKEDTKSLPRVEFKDFDELWEQLQEMYPVEIYAISVDQLSTEESVAYEVHKKADKSQYVNFQG